MYELNGNENKIYNTKTHFSTSLAATMNNNEIMSLGFVQMEWELALEKSNEVSNPST